MGSTPYDGTGNHEFYGDFAVWLAQNASDNSADLYRLKRGLRLARERELTPRQQQMLRLYFDEGMTMPAIAAELGVDKSTVSRTIARGKAKLYRCLRYAL